MSFPRTPHDHFGCVPRIRNARFLTFLQPSARLHLPYLISRNLRSIFRNIESTFRTRNLRVLILEIWTEKETCLRRGKKKSVTKRTISNFSCHNIDKILILLTGVHAFKLFVMRILCYIKTVYPCRRFSFFPCLLDNLLKLTGG